MPVCLFDCLATTFDGTGTRSWYTSGSEKASVAPAWPPAVRRIHIQYIWAMDYGAIDTLQRNIRSKREFRSHRNGLSEGSSTVSCADASQESMFAPAMP